MMDGSGYGSMGAGGWLLITVLLVTLIGFAVLAVIKLFPGRADADPQRELPEEILDRRLACGEIDEKTYDALRQKLDDGAPAGRR